jgi:hypothetical protein
MSKEPSDVGRVIARIRDLLKLCTPDKNERAIAAITALIYEGIRTRPEIVRIMKVLEFDYRHVAIALERNTGRNPAGNHWWLDADGQLHVHC